MHMDHVVRVAVVCEELSFVLITSIVHLTQKYKPCSTVSRFVHRRSVLRSTICSRLAMFCVENNLTRYSILFRFLAAMCEERNACDGTGASAGVFSAVLAEQRAPEGRSEHDSGVRVTFDFRPSREGRECTKGEDFNAKSGGSILSDAHVTDILGPGARHGLPSLRHRASWTDLQKEAARSEMGWVAS